MPWARVIPIFRLDIPYTLLVCDLGIKANDNASAICSRTGCLYSALLSLQTGIMDYVLMPLRIWCVYSLHGLRIPSRIRVSLTSLSYKHKEQITHL